MSDAFRGPPTQVERAESQPPPGWRPRSSHRSLGGPILAGLLVLLGLAAVGNAFGGPSGSPGPSMGGIGSTPRATAIVVPASSAAAPASAPGPASATLRPRGPTVTARVVRVVDGDTIIVDAAGTRSRLRYIGMDTPESVKPGTPVQPMALAATAANAALVGGRSVLLEKDVSETDRYGRLLRDVWVEHDGRLILVGLELVRTGFAQVTTFPPDVGYVDALLEAQRQAREAGIGLWAPGATATPAS